MRRELIAGNWKMYKTQKETKAFFDNNLALFSQNDKDVVFFVPFTDLNQAVQSVEKSNIEIGAQNVHFENEGAYTGEISCEMLKETGAKYVLIGHSERRKYFGETDQMVNKKLKAVLNAGLCPIICVGEQLSARQSGEYLEVIKNQVFNAVEGVALDERTAIAYEPVWAIGTGKNASSMQAEEVCSFVRGLISEISKKASEKIRILYGGSVNPNNIKDIMKMKNIDGVLVGGASLKPDFVKIVQYDKQ